MQARRRDGTKKPRKLGEGVTGGLDLSLFDFSETVLAGYLTPTQLAAQLGCCEKTLARWDAARTGPPRTTFGRRTLYRKESVSAWLVDREKRPQGKR
jgi:hypothetical protein